MCGAVRRARLGTPLRICNRPIFAPSSETNAPRPSVQRAASSAQSAACNTASTNYDTQTHTLHTPKPALQGILWYGRLRVATFKFGWYIIVSSYRGTQGAPVSSRQTFCRWHASMPGRMHKEERGFTPKKVQKGPLHCVAPAYRLVIL